MRAGLMAPTTICANAVEVRDIANPMHANRSAAAFNGNTRRTNCDLYEQVQHVYLLHNTDPGHYPAASRTLTVAFLLAPGLRFREGLRTVYFGIHSVPVCACGLDRLSAFNAWTGSI